MSVSDKAVSTEDLCTDEGTDSTALGVLKLEAFLNTLVENKVEALKNENVKAASLHSSPKRLFQRLKVNSSPKITVKVERERKTASKHRQRAKRRKTVSEASQFKRKVLRQEPSTSSPDSQICRQQSISDDEKYRYGHFYNSCVEGSCLSLPETTNVCYCHGETHRIMPVACDDYVSLKIDEYGDVETEIMLDQEEVRRVRRKRRRRRKKKMRKRLPMNPHLAETGFDQESFKHLNDDELPPRAKWTIVATACLLLFMCLLLVGITLRMAPIIDEIVREENEKLINSIANAGNMSAESVPSAAIR
ncbi:uncharacterized protein LOC132702544 [Cylas formicarius]|uniref:uncharacterized protein LOC132702544 n=1 Tax=Cylas formicarius TaxID=197179 RepID=UPI00295870F0|nr:uncharacterized protein LOC132702544 [Cylas formicarius]XP_060527219.1 uncharacterized protein LOC132702544 [Cylas formicarius]